MDKYSQLCHLQNIAYIILMLVILSEVVRMLATLDTLVHDSPVVGHAFDVQLLIISLPSTSAIA